MLVPRVSVNEGETVDLEARRGVRFDLPITYGSDDLTAGFEAVFIVCKYAGSSGLPLIEWSSPADIDLGAGGSVHIAPADELELAEGPYSYSLTLRPTGQLRDPIIVGSFLVQPMAGA